MAWEATLPATPMNTGSSRRAFTLTELLVTVAIIAILAALILAAISSAKQKAYHAKCLGNLRQLASAAIMYTQDHNGRPPGRKHPEYPGGEWMGMLKSYYKSDEVRVCPSAPLRKPLPPAGQMNAHGAADKAWIHWTRDGHTMFYGSYGYNGWLYDNNDARDGFGSFWLENEVKVDNPAMTPLFYDSSWVDAWPHIYHRPFPNLYTGQPLEVRTNSMARMIIARHGGVNPARAPRNVSPTGKLPGAINLGLYDGHAQLSPLMQLWKYSWHRNWGAPDNIPEPN